MFKTMNGWQRIRVVIAALGLIYAAWYSVSESAETYKLDGGVLLAFYNPQCRGLIADVGDTRDPPGMTSPCWLAYRYLHDVPGAQIPANVNSDHMSSRFWERTGENMIFAMIVWLAGFGLFYFVGEVVRWVRLGFSQPRAEQAASIDPQQLTLSEIIASRTL